MPGRWIEPSIVWLLRSINQECGSHVLVYRDHVAAVMDVEFSPTGEELVSASYDRTIRLWDRGTGHSRDIYHTKRMQRVFSATWTSDSKYVLSGSDDGNIRYVFTTHYIDLNPV